MYGFVGGNGTSRSSSAVGLSEAHFFGNGDCRDGSDRPDEHLVCPAKGCSFLWSLDRALGFWQDRWSIGRRIEGGPGFTSRATFLNVTVEMNPPLEKP